MKKEIEIAFNHIGNDEMINWLEAHGLWAKAKDFKQLPGGTVVCKVELED